jgi:DNA ligase (NAD+)
MSGNPLSDKTVVVTGTLSEMTRKEAEAKIVELGGTTASRVTAATDLLIAGEKAGSKKKQAETLGVDIIDEAAFVRMIEGGEAEPVVLSEEQLKEIKELL